MHGRHGLYKTSPGLKCKFGLNRDVYVYVHICFRACQSWEIQCWYNLSTKWKNDIQVKASQK